MFDAPIKDTRFYASWHKKMLAEYAIYIVMENAMPTRNVVLTDSQAQFVEQMVRSGRYQNASEVMREGLRLVQAREAEQAARLAALREAVAVGVADIEAGRYTEFADAASLRSHINGISRRVLAKRE
ncbi:MAG: type II toxin-antitoxin system ParD family antitoxin [Acidovorax sp.]